MPHKRAPKSLRSSPSDDDSSVVEIVSPPPPQKRAKKNAPSSVNQSASKKRMAASPSDGNSSVAEITPPPQKKARKNVPGSVDYNALPPVSITSPTKSTHSIVKRLSFGSIKPDSPGDSKGDHIDLESPLNIAKEKRSRKPFAKAVYMADTSRKRKEQQTNTSPAAASGEEDSTRPSHPDMVSVVSDDSEPEKITPLFQKKTNKKTSIEEHSELPLTTPPRKAPKFRTDPDSEGDEGSNDSNEAELPRYLLHSASRSSHKSTKIENSTPKQDKPSSKTIKSKSARLKSPTWDIEEAGRSGPPKNPEATKSSKDPEPLPAFELLPYSDKVQYNDSYMLASDALYECLEGGIAKTIKAAVNFTQFGPFVNFARADLNAVENRYKGLTISGQKNLAVSLLTGGVVSCNLIIPKPSTREGAADSKCISVIPILVEYERYISYIGLKLGSQAIHGPIYNSSYLTFSTRKDGGTSDIASQSEPGTPAKNKFFVKQAIPVTSAGWYSKPFPGFLSFGENVPIYDLRGSSFSFRKEDFDELRHLPQFEFEGTPKDLPGNSLVTIAHTVSSFVGDGRKVLSLNVQFVLFHGYPRHFGG
ncbi:hypothetical protein BYT27DRAFT_7264998 [Phlegmacium glaucopus]|nr:hypothetical protein BYT27DRAFT_7264998 [Phlegmacium glaucopus]